jgi:hypothetical protein
MGTPTTTPPGSEHQTSAWHFNDRLNIITHEARSCETCTLWALHYMESVFAEDTSLSIAEEQRNNSILSSVMSENASLHDNNEALHHKLATICLDVEKMHNALKLTCRDLSCTRDQHDTAEDGLNTMCDKYAALNDRADDTISELHERITELEHHTMPCCHKVVRRDTSLLSQLC